MVFFRSVPLGLLLGVMSLEAADRFTIESIDEGLEIGYGLAVADVDGDGKADIVLADKHQFVWYHNPGWEKHVISEALTERDHVCIAARDIDGDGRCEIAVGAEWNPGDTETSGAVFYLIPPEDRTKLWQPVQLTHEPTTHRMRWVRTPQGTHELLVLPLHGRGNKKGAGAGVKLLAYRMPEDPTQPWPTRLVHEGLHMTHNFDVVPAAEGQAEEILLAGREGIKWLVQREDGEWRARWLVEQGEAGPGAGEVRWGAFADGRSYVASIEPMHGENLVLYTPPPSGPKDGVWTRTVLDDSLVDGHALATRDLLGLGNRQIVVGWRSSRQVGPRVGIKLWSTSKADGSGWQSKWVDDNGIACEDLRIADLDNDGDYDIVACGRRSRNVRIYWQN